MKLTCEKKKEKKRGGGNCYEKIRYDLIYSTEYEEEIKDLPLNRCFKIMDELEMYVMGRG